MQGPVGVSEVVVFIVIFSFEILALRGASQRPTLVWVISGACWLGHFFFFCQGLALSEHCKSCSDVCLKDDRGQCLVCC